MKTGDDVAAPGTIDRPSEAAWDCPVCGVTASVRDDFCDVCSAELDEFRLEPWDDPREIRKPRR
jgi:rubrerythrin